MAEMKMLCMFAVIVVFASNADALRKTTDDVIAGIIENLQKEVHDLKQLKHQKKDEKKEESGDKGWKNIFDGGEDVTVKDTSSSGGKSIFEANEEANTRELAEKGEVDGEEEGSKLEEEDIILTNVQEQIVGYDEKFGIGNDALLNPAALWRKQTAPLGSRVQVPYQLDANVRSNVDKLNAINKAVKNYREKTCIDFYEKSSTETVHFIRVINGQGCYSYIGRVGISTCNNCQPVSIGNGCQYSGTVEHEFLHALGFFHEQSRPDRDDHVTINWNNIMDGLEGNFKKQFGLNLGGQGYDLKSVMHYGGGFFSKNGQPTIVYKGTNTGVKANRAGFSEIDLAQINAIYKCEAEKTTTTTTTTTLAPTTTTTEEPTPEPSPEPTEPPAPRPAPEECEALAEVGMCKLSWICNSCGIQCENATSAEQQNKLKLDLKDIKRSCQAWAGKGYCEPESKYHRYMLHKCLKTCFEKKYEDVIESGNCLNLEGSGGEVPLP